MPLDLTTSLAAYYPLAIDGKDYSGNGRDFTAVGTPVHAAVDGYLCAQNIGATNYYTIASASWLASQSVFTVAGWFRRTSTDAAALHAAVTFGGAATVATVMYPINQNTTTGYREFCNNAVTFAPNDNLPGVGAWKFICRVVSSTSLCTVYRDALTPLTYTATSCATPASCALRIGNYYNGGVQAYDGDIRDLRIWTGRALSAAEVDALRTLGPPTTSGGIGIGIGIGTGH